MSDDKNMTAAEARREAQIDALMAAKKDKDGKDLPARARSRKHAEFLIKTESV